MLGIKVVIWREKSGRKGGGWGRRGGKEEGGECVAKECWEAITGNLAGNLLGF